MKTFFTLLVLATFPFGESWGQSRHCDEIVQRSDTTVCQDFTGKGKLFREQFYVGGERIFTRWWRYKKGRVYECVQKKGKTPFAKKNGPAIRFYPDGKVKYYTVFHNGIPVNNCFSYYPSGALKGICHRNNAGKIDGLLTDFHENGQISHQARWENGTIMEIISNKDEQGNDLPIGTFKDGNGTWIWQEKGKPTFVYTYKNGKPVGRKRLKQ